MYENEYTRINGRKPSITAYYNEFTNTNPITDGTEDYKMYLTRSLMTKGILNYNSKKIEELYKERIDTLYEDTFKNLFLYDINRNIKGLYTDVDSVIKMNVVGYYDFMSSLLLPNTAKFFKLIEPFTPKDYDILSLIEGEDDEDTKKLKLVEILDARVMDELHQCVENIRIFMTYPLYTPIKTLMDNSENVNFRNMNIVYNSIDRVFTFLALYFSVKDLIGDLSPIFNSYIKTIDNLKNMEILADMSSPTKYFTKQVLNTYMTDNICNRYDFLSCPIFDIYSDEYHSNHIVEIIVSYCENAMNLRYMVKDTVNETDFDILFATLLAYTNIYIQSFYIKSFVTFKEPGGQSVKDMFRKMNPIQEALNKNATYSILKEVINNDNNG